MDLGLLQREVAGRLGVDKFTLLNWERGKTAPDVRYYPAIIAFLGYNPLPRGETFQEKLKAARQARGLSWKRLAEELGVRESTVRDWEYGVHSPTGWQREAILRFIGLPDDSKRGARSSLSPRSVKKS